ncbi:MAG: PAS domain S-box protein, partial [Desulfobacterales bacterium]|nr:PAS domain S-box protein [Desulfobacterales bacterium]
TAELAKANEELKLEIEERKRADGALRESEERYRRIVETAQEGIWMIDAAGKTDYVNQQMAKMLGYTVEEMSGRFLFDFICDFAPVEALQNFERRKHEITGQRDFRLRRKDGSDLWAMISTSPMFDDNGQFIGALGMIIDITRRKQAEEALLESEKKYSTLVENSLTGIYIDQCEKIVFANNRFAEIFGFPKEELMGIESWKLVHAEDRALNRELRARMLRGEGAPSEYEARGLTKDGETVWIVGRNTGIEYNGNPAILGNIVDVTEQKRAEKGLREADEEFKCMKSSS